MIRVHVLRLVSLGLIIWIGLASASVVAQGVRPEVGKPLQAAQDLAKARKYKEALAKVNDADAVANKTPHETYLIERTRGSLAAQAGDNDTAIRSFEAVIASGRLPKGEQLKMLEAVAGMHYRSKEYAKAAAAAARYFREGGADPQVRTVLVQSYYLAGDCANAAREMQAQLQAAEQAGRAPSEDQLQLLASCYYKRKDHGGYALALEKLLTYYPKKEYWSDVIRQIQNKPGFSDRLALDVYRLKFAIGSMVSANEYMEMAQLALQAGFPVEARKVIDQGFSAGILGNGAEAERQKRLRDLATKSVGEEEANLAKNEAEAAAAKDGMPLIDVGYQYVNRGQFNKGLALMEQGIRKGGFKRVEDAKLHLGIAYYNAGQKAKAQQILKTVQGTDGTADLARLWSLHARRTA